MLIRSFPRGGLLPQDLPSEGGRPVPGLQGGWAGPNIGRVLRERRGDADNHGVKVRTWPVAAFAGGVLGAGLSAAAGSPEAAQVAMFAAPGGVAVALAAAGAWHFTHRARPDTFNLSFASALPEWRAGRRGALEGMVAEFAGPAATAHALRCSALADLLAEQLALQAAEAADLVLAGALHVLPAAFPENEDARQEGCAFSAPAIAAATAVLGRTAPAGAAQTAMEVRERWDGSGVPGRLAGEQCSLGGRILAAICAFDHASGEGLERGLEALRQGSGSAFDPVVVSEVLYLFREPWQSKVAA